MSKKTVDKNTKVEKKPAVPKMKKNRPVQEEGNMPSPRFNRIAHKIMCGLKKGQPTKEQFEAFKEKHKAAIVWVDNHMPSRVSGRMISMGVLGAIGKGVLWFGKDKMESFCQAISKGDFNGAGDPAHILWLWLSGRSKYNCEMAYRKTVAAIRSYVVGKQFLRVRKGREEIGHFAPAETDLFDWDSTYTTMLKRHSNTSKKAFAIPQAEGPSEEELRLAEEIEKAMASIR